MKYIDFHADTLTELEEGETLGSNRKMVSLEELLKAECQIQCFSAFVPTGFLEADQRDALAWQKYREICRRYQETLEQYPEQLRPILGASDAQSCERDGKTGILFTIEDGGVLGADMKKLHQVHADGVRLITLTWNHANAIGYPNSADPQKMERGLKDFGMELIGEMERLGMMIDVSHLSDGGFWDVYYNTRKPFLASHSNARALSPHPRNLTDEMIRAIAERGGVIGLNLYGPFLMPDGRHRISRVEDMVRHVRHIYRIGGAEVLAIGSDFDGITGELEIAKPTELEKLFDALRKDGLPETVLEKMCLQNGMRLLSSVLK